MLGFIVCLVVMVYGDGKIVGHDLERTEEASPVLSFLIERYPVVIGKGFFSAFLW